jgi:hypothetical protein
MYRYKGRQYSTQGPVGLHDVSTLLSHTTVVLTERCREEMTQSIQKTVDRVHAKGDKKAEEFVTAIAQPLLGALHDYVRHYNPSSCSISSYNLLGQLKTQFCGCCFWYIGRRCSYR